MAGPGKHGTGTLPQNPPGKLCVSHFELCSDQNRLLPWGDLICSLGLGRFVFLRQHLVVVRALPADLAGHWFQGYVFYIISGFDLK